MMKSESFRESETTSSSSAATENKRIRQTSMSVPPPIIHQPSSRFQSIRFVRSYLFSTQGLLCCILILIEFAGLISSAAIPKLVNNEIHLLPEFAAIRDAYLFFAIFGLLFNIFILIIYSFNFKTVKPFNKIPLVLIIIAIDIMWLIAFFILAILCAAKEESLKDPTFIYGQYINTGAYGSASFFGFAASLVYGVDAGFLILKAMRGNLAM